jgi:hypothetical protein
MLDSKVIESDTFVQATSSSDTAVAKRKAPLDDRGHGEEIKIERNHAGFFSAVRVLSLGCLVIGAAVVGQPVHGADCGGKWTCDGECPPGLNPFCQSTVFTGTCFCAGLTGDTGWFVGVIPNGNSTLTDSSGGSNWFSIGNRITVQQAGSATVHVVHTPAWGGGSQDINVGDLSVSMTATVTGNDQAHPHRRLLQITSLGAVLPSFASVALSGGQTGDNTFSIDPDRTSTGWVDISTGQVEIQFYGRFFNGVFTSSPALVQSHISAVFDLGTHHLQFPSNISISAESPGDGLW